MGTGTMQDIWKRTVENINNMGTNLEKPQETGRYNGNPYGSFYCWSPHVMGTRSSAKNTGRYNGNQREPAKEGTGEIQI